MSGPSQPEGARAEAAAPRAKRPRWLVFSLVFALLLGASSWSEGCTRLELYRSGPALSAELHAGIQDAAARARAEADYERLLDVLHGSRARTAPLAAATFVLGAALLALASRGLGGRKGARPLLVQVVTVQALVAIGTYFLARDVRLAEHAWEDARRDAAAIDQDMPAPFREKMDRIGTLKREVGAPGWLAFRTLGSALVVIALTRPRTRRLFDDEPDEGMTEG